MALRATGKFLRKDCFSVLHFVLGAVALAFFVAGFVFLLQAVKKNAKNQRDVSPCIVTNEACWVSNQVKGTFVTFGASGALRCGLTKPEQEGKKFFCGIDTGNVSIVLLDMPFQEWKSHQLEVEKESTRLTVGFFIAGMVVAIFNVCFWFFLAHLRSRTSPEYYQLVEMRNLQTARCLLLAAVLLPQPENCYLSILNIDTVYLIINRL
jgi:hypothetical protein